MRTLQIGLLLSAIALSGCGKQGFSWFDFGTDKEKRLEKAHHEVVPAKVDISPETPVLGSEISISIRDTNSGVQKLQLEKYAHLDGKPAPSKIDLGEVNSSNNAASFSFVLQPNMGVDQYGEQFSVKNGEKLYIFLEREIAEDVVSRTGYLFTVSD